jgi:hypothetical protein
MMFRRTDGRRVAKRLAADERYWILTFPANDGS